MPSSFYPNPGGVEEVSRQLALGLRRRGHEPLVATNRWPKRLPESETFEGLPIIRPSFRVPHPSARGIGGWLLYARATRTRLLREARSRHTDLVNVHCVSTNGKYAVELARALDLPLVVSIHGELSCDATNVYERSPYMMRLYRNVVRAADFVTAPSEYSLREAEHALGHAIRNAVVIGNGVDADLFSRPRITTADPYVFAVGRLEHTKGFDLLIAAWDLLPPRFSDHRLVIGGDGAEHGRLVRQAAATSASARIELLGRLDRSAVAERMRGASAFVLPSRVEAQGLTVLEAMAAGTPVVASRVGGVPETVESGVNGLLFEPESAPALAEAITDILDDASAAAARAQAGRITAEQRSWDRLTEQFLTVYTKAEA